MLIKTLRQEAEQAQTRLDDALAKAKESFIQKILLGFGYDGKAHDQVPHGHKRGLVQTTTHPNNTEVLLFACGNSTMASLEKGSFKATVVRTDTMLERDQSPEAIVETLKLPPEKRPMRYNGIIFWQKEEGHPVTFAFSTDSNQVHLSVDGCLFEYDWDEIDAVVPDFPRYKRENGDDLYAYFRQFMGDLYSKKFMESLRHH